MCVGEGNEHRAGALSTRRASRLRVCEVDLPLEYSPHNLASLRAQRGRAQRLAAIVCPERSLLPHDGQEKRERSPAHQQHRGRRPPHEPGGLPPRYPLLQLSPEVPDS